jgi:hypothetical protein
MIARVGMDFVEPVFVEMAESLCHVTGSLAWCVVTDCSFAIRCCLLVNFHVFAF